MTEIERTRVEIRSIMASVAPKQPQAEKKEEPKPEKKPAKKAAKKEDK